MTSLKNYSKWDNLELSDDEDNFHPNIDNNLMIRLQREKRQQREAEEAEQLRKLREDGSETALAQIAKMEKTKKLHVDNICSEKFNSKHEKSSAASSANPTAHVEQKVTVTPFDESNFTDGYEAFVKEKKALLMEYAAIDEEDERTEQFIIDHPELLSEHATGFYLIHCINLQVEGKARDMKKMARQYLLLTYVCDLAKTMPGRDAREAIRPLFKKMGQSKETSEAFAEHLGKYIAHVKTRAEVKKKELAEEAEGEAGVEYVPLKKGEQVGPGGLDPAEVFESLPRVLQEAFGERDIDALKTALQTLSAEDAEYHMKRCTDSGLWDPGGGGGAEDSADVVAVQTPSAEVDD